MTEQSFFNYEDSIIEIRDDIKQTYKSYWRQLRKPGTCWQGTERIAIAQEVRNATTCQFCTDRKQALSPYTFAGEHKCDNDLPIIAIDAIHRIVTDQHRITASYISHNLTLGLSYAAYVEICGIVVAVFSIDEFNRSLGLALETLPTAIAGDVVPHTPENLESETAFVPMISIDGTTGVDADLWRPDKTANVLRALSLIPEAVRDWCKISTAQYLSIEGMANFIGQKDRAINRMQMELVAGRISSYNECFY